MNFEYLLVRFLLYAFIGWILESGYKTIGQGRGFINSGFLRGPIIPIYGFGAIIMIVLERQLASLLMPLTRPVALVCEVLLFTLVCTAFEYFIGWFYETVFKIKLWDYSKKPFNLKGRICLKNTLLWALLVAAFILFIEPAVNALIAAWLSGPIVRPLSYTAGILTLADATVSTFELKSTADFLNRLKEKMSMGDPASIRALFSKMSNRFVRQFPNLREIANERLHRFLAEDFMQAESKSAMLQVQKIVREPALEESAMDPAYFDAVKDILANEKVQSMAGIPHHDASVLKHSLTVSEASFVLAQRYKLDARSTARGALLHDFFLYDWRKTKVKHHATGHARTALKNAQACFNLNEIESDIILTHMWPLSKHFYRYRESFIVSVMDKFVSAHEMRGTDFAEIIRDIVAKRFPRQSSSGLLLSERRRER